MYPVLFFLMVLFSVQSIGPATGDIPGDRIKTEKGDLIVHPISHATFVMEWDGKLLYVDPVGDMESYSDLPAPDLILYTDTHGDHLNLETLKSVDTRGARIIAPLAVVEQLPEEVRNRVTAVNNGDQTVLLDISIEAIPMYNLQPQEIRHVKGRGNGYVLSMGGKRIYISGDTADIPEMRHMEGIDVAFVCMNLPYTMDIEAAADAVLAFIPAIVYPYHYRGSGGLSDVEGFKKLVNENSEIDVRLRDWYR